MIYRSYLIVIVALAASTQYAVAGDRSLNDQFVTQYSEGFHRLETFYRNIEMAEETTGSGADIRFGGKLTFHWRSSGSKFRDDMISLSGAIAESKLSRGDVSCRIYSTSPGRLARVAPSGKYALT